MVVLCNVVLGENAFLIECESFGNHFDFRRRRFFSRPRRGLVRSSNEITYRVVYFELFSEILVQNLTKRARLINVEFFLLFHD